MVASLVLEPALAGLGPTDGQGSGSAGPTRYTVAFYEMPTLRAGDSYHGAHVVLVNEVLRFAAVEVNDPLAWEGRVRLLDEVRLVEPSKVYRALEFIPNDPQYPDQFPLAHIGASVAWETSLGATNSLLCTADTGVRYTHEDLAGRILGGTSFIGYLNNSYWDFEGHGTMVTGIAVASTNNSKGVAGIAQASYKHARVLDPAGQGFADTVASGIQWCADNGAHVISLSLGGGPATIIEDAVNYAWQKGVLMVAAAGNSGCSPCVDHPAAYGNVIAVACTTVSKQLCSFSSRGPEVDIAAAGLDVPTTSFESDTAYELGAGTSASTPHVAGAALVLKSIDPSLTNAGLRDLLLDNAQDLGPAGWDESFGHGLLRLDLAVNPLPPPSVILPPEVIFAEDFDDGSANDFTLTGLWHVSSPCSTAPSPPNYLGYNRDSDCTYNVGNTRGNATFFVDLRRSVFATLEFKHVFEVELDGWVGTYSYDRMRVEVSENGGLSWFHIGEWDPDGEGTPADWRDASVLLDPYTGRRLGVRFSFDTRDQLYNDYLGWLLDDVKVVARQVPGVPAAPVLTALRGDQNVTLSWTTPADAGSNITEYRVYRGTAADALSLVATLDPVNTYLDTGLTNGVTYYYNVSAVNENGEGPGSDVASATPRAPQAPTPPRNLTVQRGPANGEVTLTWEAPEDPGGLPITAYRVYRGTLPAVLSLHQELGVAFEYKDTPPDPLATYYYHVRAVNAVGEGAASNEVSQSPTALPSAPQTPFAVRGPGDGNITLTWRGPADPGGLAITNYRIYRGVASGDLAQVAEVGGDVLSYLDAGLDPLPTYHYAVAAVNAKGEGTRSIEVLESPSDLPTEPLGLAVAKGPGAGQLTLSWQPPVDPGGIPLLGYRVHRGNESTSLTPVADLVDVLTFTDTGLPSNSTRHYRVAALNAKGEGALSNLASNRTYAPPHVPTLNAARGPGAGEATLTWDPPAEEGPLPITAYRVYRSPDPGSGILVEEVGPVTTFRDTGLPSGDTRYYRVSAVTDAGEGARSNEAAARTYATPSWPTSLQVLPEPFGKVRLSWQAPTFTDGLPVLGYCVYHGTAPGEETLAARLGPVLAYTDTNRGVGAWYYKVSAYTAAGEGLVNQAVSVGTALPAAEPPGERDCVPGQEQVNFAFDVSDEGFRKAHDHVWSEVEWDPLGFRVKLVSDRSDSGDEVFSRLLQAPLAPGASFQATARWRATTEGHWQSAFPLFLGGEAAEDLDAAPNTLSVRYDSRDFAEKAPQYTLRYRDAAGVLRMQEVFTGTARTEYNFLLAYDAPTRTVVAKVRALDGTDLAGASYALAEGEAFTFQHVGSASHGIDAPPDSPVRGWVDDVILLRQG